MTRHELTGIIHAKGWTVKSACQRWKMKQDTYYKHANESGTSNKCRIVDMVSGLPIKGEE